MWFFFSFYCDMLHIAVRGISEILETSGHGPEQPGLRGLAWVGVLLVTSIDPFQLQ